MKKPAKALDLRAVASLFEAVESATLHYSSLWNRDLKAPLLLVDPQNRSVFANSPDFQGILHACENIYTGTLPPDVVLANTATEWAGRRWAMVLLPLPDTFADCIRLVTHELFHVHQPALGFDLSNPDNPHLNQEIGRVSLRLELAALQKALQCSTLENQKTHILHALLFRLYRYALYPQARSTENSLDLNEGLAEYTGNCIAEQSPSETIQHFQKSGQQFLNNPSFSRAFAYQTLPIYGYLLKQHKPYWNQEITQSTDLTDYLIKAFEIKFPADQDSARALALSLYDGQRIFEEEQAKTRTYQQRVSDYREKLFECPHFSIPLTQMNLSFDPRNVIVVEDLGTIYPTLEMVAPWGAVTVNNGALINPDKTQLSLALPLIQVEDGVRGDGWMLEIAVGYEVRQDIRTGHYVLKKA